jgi:hypothetical protein
VKLIDLGAAVVLMVGPHAARAAHPRGPGHARDLDTNLEAARLMGVPTNRIIAVTFGLGSALAGAGGILFGLDQPLAITPLTGVQPGLKAFVAAVLGGIGNIPGAMLGGLLIGVVEQLARPTSRAPSRPRSCSRSSWWCCSCAPRGSSARSPARRCS